jgi:hypothetical protein
VSHETETIRVYDELLDLAGVSGATGEVLCNSWVLLSAVSDRDVQHGETTEGTLCWKEALDVWGKRPRERIGR